MTSDDDLGSFERVFWQVGNEDFLLNLKAFGNLLPIGLNSINGNLRPFEKACEEFFSENSIAWPRYDAYLAFWGEADPRLELDEDEEEPAGYAMPPGELLAHRIVMSFYGELGRARYLENTDARPYWKLTVIEDGRTHPACLQEAKAIHRFDSPYWQVKRLPCKRLFCRCRLTAFTKSEAREQGLIG